MVQVYQEQIISIKDYILKVEDTTKSMKKVRDLDVMMKEYEKDLNSHNKEINKLNTTIIQKNVKFYFVRLFLIVKYCIVDNIENEIVDMCCHFTR